MTAWLAIATVGLILWLVWIVSNWTLDMIGLGLRPDLSEPPTTGAQPRSEKGSYDF